MVKWTRDSASGKVSFLLTSEGIYKETYNSSRRTTVTEFASWDRFPGYTPSNSTADPPEPENGWECVLGESCSYEYE